MPKYRVSMLLPMSFDVDAADDIEAKRMIANVKIAPYGNPPVALWENYSVGFYEMTVAAVKEPELGGFDGGEIP